MNFVIGDIHGEINKLKQLIDHINNIDSNYNLIFVGDYLDKGDNPKEVLDYLISISKHHPCVFLLGNHEYFWMKEELEVEEYLLKYGGKQTIKSFKSDSVSDTKKILKNEYNVFFENLVPYYICKNYFICHSGIKMSNFNKSASEMQETDFLFNRFDFISSQQLFQDKYVIIFGHTGFYAPYVDEYKIGIDTGACYLEKQPLTAFCIEKSFFLNSDCNHVHLSTIADNCNPNIIRTKPWREIDLT